MNEGADHRGGGVALFAATSPAVERYLADLVGLAGIEIVSRDARPAIILGYEGGRLWFETEEGVRTAIDVPVRASKLAVLLCRALQGGAERALPLGPYQFLPQDFLLIDKDGQGMRLTEKETAILSALYVRRGVAISRQELLDEVWGYALGVETHTLETHIYRLRQKIEQDPSAPKLLVTTDEGYALAL